MTPLTSRKTDMYPDPKRVRDHRITIRLDDYEFAFFISLANLIGEQPAALARRVLLREATQLCSSDSTVEPRSA